LLRPAYQVCAPHPIVSKAKEHTEHCVPEVIVTQLVQALF
jgi:hypothetical protein